MSTAGSPQVRLNITLPPSVAEDLQRVVPARQRARFIAETLASELHRMQVDAALAASAGAWADEDHPELLGEGAIDHWLAEGRQGLKRDGEGNE